MSDLIWSEAEKEFALEMAENNLNEALRFLRMGRPKVADHYARLARHRLYIAMQEA